MIDKKIARHLMEQFRGMNSAPKNREELDMRIESLAAAARSESHAREVCAALLDRLAFFPNIADLRQACANTADPASEESRQAARQCPHCHGSGWRSAQGPFCLSAAYPCDHRPEPNKRMGISFTPAMNSRYMQEARESDRRQEEWLRGRAEKPSAGFRRITQADVDAVIAERGI